MRAWRGRPRHALRGRKLSLNSGTSRAMLLSIARPLRGDLLLHRLSDATTKTYAMPSQNSDNLMHNLENTFAPLLVPELLSGDFRFLVPSYQRGYRWGPQEVEDLLNDLYSFVRSKDGSVYFLQPIVVRPIDKGGQLWWEVLDGQQRLTTMLLILKRFLDRLGADDCQDFQGRLYRITYSNRPEINFDNPDPMSNLDSYHVKMAKEVIDLWVKRKTESECRSTLTKIADALFFKDNSEKIVSFIWYSVPADGKEKESIALFNRLNKGRIRLTGSELVKALFVLDNKNADTEHAGEARAVAQFSLDWDEIVRRLQNDNFWFFLSDDLQAQTRMDALLTFVTGMKTDEDGYRQFQKAYDYFHASEKNLEKFSLSVKDYNSFARMWTIIRRGFDDWMRWYEDADAYNYVGWLVRNGISLHGIKEKWDSASPHEVGSGIVRIEDHCAKLREAISNKLNLKRKNDGALDRDALLDIQYDSNSRPTQTRLKNLLLLFNVESSRRGGNRFPFDRYEKEKKKAGWDLEHIDSQTDNNLQSIEDRINWIGYVLEVLSWMPESLPNVTILQSKGKQLKAKMETSHEDEGNEFGLFYSDVVRFFSSDEDNANSGGLPKDSIANLTLLDAGTNRAYKNAPFPYKRMCIISRDRNGGFVPLCTKNLFLKYYSDSEKNTKQLDVFRWGFEDQEKYFRTICDLLDGFKSEDH